MDAFVRIKGNDLVEGWVTTLPTYSNKYQSGATITMYFSARLDKPADSFGTFVKETVQKNNREIEGIGAGAYLTYNTQDNELITAKVGLFLYLCR